MCGLFGFSGKRPVDETKLRWLAVENQVRGGDSTGVFGSSLYKDKLNARELILTPGFRAAIKGQTTVLGHTRAATVGSVNKENAHPFYYYNEAQAGFPVKVPCVGAHNGFLLDVMMPHTEETFGFKAGQFDVDSQMIFAVLAKTGDVNNISKLEGAMGLSFIFPTLDPETLYLYKREETRELHIGEAADGLYYSSAAMPLRLIGCRTIWPLLPNMLYTIRQGEIIDVYAMPSPIVKSLSVGVSRSQWRVGVPIAEINALPCSARSHNHTNVMRTRVMDGNESSEDWTTGRLGFQSDYTYKSKQKLLDTPKLKRDLVASYKDQSGGMDQKDSVKAKFGILLANIRSDLKNMGVTPITSYGEITERGNDKMLGCLLAINLRNKSSNKALIAWAVTCDDNVDLSGLTSMNGITLISVPPAMCDKELTYQVYDPVDRLGPYSFKVKAEAQRVKEVTLLIPFQQGGDEEKRTTPTVSRVQPSEDCMGQFRGGNSYSCDFPAVGGSGAYEHDEGAYPGVLPSNTQSLLGGHQEGQTDEVQAFAVTADDISETFIGASLLTLEQKLEQMIPSIPNLNKRVAKIQWLVEVDIDFNTYRNWQPLHKTWNAIIGSKDYLAWRNLYIHLKTKVDGATLVLDAARLQAWDRDNVKAQYRFDIYIELLLELFPIIYTLPSYKRSPDYNPELLKPSTYAKHGLAVGSLGELMKKKEKLKRGLPSSISSMYQAWRLCRLTDDEMLTIRSEDLKFAQEYCDQYDVLIADLNAQIQSREHNLTQGEHDLRETLISTRNFLRDERMSLSDFISVVSHSKMKLNTNNSNSKIGKVVPIS